MKFLEALTRHSGPITAQSSMLLNVLFSGAGMLVGILKRRLENVQLDLVVAERAFVTGPK